MLNPHEHDLAPSRYEDDHASGCPCDRCLGPAEEWDVTLEAAIEANYQYDLDRRRAG